MNQDRLIEIETKLAFQEDTLIELNDVVVAQEKRLAHLEETVKSLLARIKILTASLEEAKQTNEKPPHY